MVKKFLALVCVFGCAGIGSGQLTDVERTGMRDSLYMANLAERDLGFDRAVYGQDAAFSRANQWHAKPMDGFESMARLQPVFPKRFSDWLRLFGKERNFRTSAPTLAEPVLDEAGLSAIPEAYRPTVVSLCRAIMLASAEIRASISKLTSDERRQLIESLPVVSTTGALVKFDFAKLSPLEESQLLGLIAKIDQEKLYLANVRLAEKIDVLIEKLSQIRPAKPYVGVTKLNVGGFILVFAGNGANEHTDRDAVLTIDLGGDDIYRGRHGAGVGYASVLLDLGGDDRYEVPDLSVGAGVLGAGFAYDASGRDIYDGKSICFGSGLLGYGILLDGGGRDQFTSSTLAQGFGAYGGGALFDSGGHDTYLLAAYGQGCGTTEGQGWLFDADGNDTYRSVGVEMRTVSERDVTGSYAQAAAYPLGLSSDVRSGGMGVVRDGAGHDIYVSTRRAQGYAENAGLAMLYDLQGDDTYRIQDLGQSYGTKSGIAWFTDEKGDDAYNAGLGVGLGAATDFGAAWFIDRSGDDTYAGTFVRPATSLNGALTVFVDVEGNDRYLGPIQQTNTLGSVFSVSLFADLNGDDRYQDGLEDGLSMVMTGLAIAADLSSQRKATSQDNPSRVPPKAGSVPDPGAAAIAKLYNVAANSPEVEQREDSMHQLMGIGLPSMDWAIAQKLGRCRTQDRFILGSLALHIGPDARNQLAFKVTDPNDAVAYDALLICGEFAIKEAGSTIVGALDRPALRRTAARFAGEFQELASVPSLMLACADPDSRTVIFALRSLAALADPQSVGTGQALLGSPNPLVRQAAAELVSRFADIALKAADGLLASLDENIARTGVSLLAQIASKDALDKLGQLLRDSRGGVRIEAALALHRRCPLEFRGAFLQLRNDPDPRVRQVARRLSPGS